MHGCGGLFLDRGELERLTATEAEWHQSPPVQQQHQPQHQPQYGQEQYRHSQTRPQPSKKRKSFLSELFDD